MTRSKAKYLFITTLVTVAIMAMIYYLALPAINLRSPGFWWFIFFAALVFAVVASAKYWINEYLGDEWEETDFYAGVCIRSWIAAGGLLLVIVVLAVISAMWWPGTNQAACTVADITKAESIAEDFPDLSDSDAQSELPMVDMDTAITLGDKKIAGLANSPWYEVDEEYNLIEYQGRYYRLSVIDYGGFLKYNKAANSGVPGYVMVECTPENGIVTQSAIMVELDEPIKYTPGAFWSHDLWRHLRGQYPGYMFEDCFLEIDEEGTPYWVTGVKRPTCGVWAVPVVKSFILTNAQTGESYEYSVEDAPEWIDHIYPLNYLMTLADWHYKYQNGWWNSWTSQTGVWKTSYSYKDERGNKKEDGEFANFYGYSSTTVNGQVVFYTGLTAANKAESNLGWLTIDTSSGKMTEYDVVGAEESSAQAAVEQLVAAQGYQATFPLPANIAGQASYIMCLKGKAGLVQGYAICNMENYSIAVQAPTLPEAVDMYLARLGQKPADSETANTTPPATGDEASPSLFDNDKVVESYSVEINGTTQYYYVLEDGSLYCVVRVK